MKKIEIKELYEFVMDSALGSETIINGEKYLYFGGVGYFQLHSHPEVIEAAVTATRKFGMNSATSRMTTGMTRLHFEVETRAADFFGCEDAVYLPSGYLSNIAGIQALYKMGKFDVIFIDETAHYCNRDGAYSVNRPVYVFKSNDIKDLEQKLKYELKPHEKPLIVTDGIFSVFGTIANAPGYLELAEMYDGVVWIDDAHASGILGSNGRGTYEYYNLKSGRLFWGSTLSKAFGGFGGIIPGDKEFTQYVRNGNVMNGGSQPVYAAAAASLKGIELVMANPNMREDLWENARYLKVGLASLGIPTEDNCLPIASFSAGNMREMKMLHDKLLKRHLFIQLTRYIGAGQEGVLRMVVFSTHRKSQIQYLIDTLRTEL